MTIALDPTGTRLTVGVDVLVVPSAADRTPAGWWHVASVTGVAASRLCGDGRASALTGVVSRLEAAVVTAGGSLGEGWGAASLRTAWVRAVWPERKPYCFVERSDMLIDQARALFADVYPPGVSLFRWAGHEGWSTAIAYRQDGGVAVRELRSIDAAYGPLHRALRFCRAGHPPKPAALPRDVARDLRHYPSDRWPILDGVCRVPVLRADGSLLPEGYDAGSRMYVAPAFAVSVPESPSAAEVLAAREVLLTPWREFPLVSGCAGLIAPVAEQVLRGLIDGPRPMYVVSAPPGGQGTGKTLAARVVAALILGRDPATATLHGGEAETSKLLTSLVRTREAAHVIDNITGVLSSDSLAALTTSTEWRGRTLGKSEAPALPQLATWLLTANGARLSADLARRCVVVGMDARGGRGTPGRYAIPNLLRWATTHRVAYVEALLTCARGWISAQSPGPARVLGSYESWSTVVGGLLEWLEIEGLSAGLDAATETDTEAAEAAELVAAWQATWGSGPVRIGPLTDLARRLGLYPDVLGRCKYMDVSYTHRAFSTEVLATLLGKAWVCEGVGRVTVLRGRDRSHATTYRVVDAVDRYPTEEHRESELSHENH